MKSNIADVREEIETSPPERILQWAVEEFGDSLVMSSSFGADSAVLIHLATRALPTLPIIFVDTGFLFEETMRYMHELRERFALRVLVYRPLKSAQEYLVANGERDPQWRMDVERCCGMNKNEPFERAMRELRPSAWLRGIRKDQAETRRGKRVLEWSERFNCYAISPLLNWSEEQMEQYIREHHLPRHALVDSGYRSIGCKPLSCTRPVQLGESPRAGRWSGREKTECGLHL